MKLYSVQKSEPRTPLTPNKLFEDELEDTQAPPPIPKKEPSEANKFGWILGVLVSKTVRVKYGTPNPTK